MTKRNAHNEHNPIDTTTGPCYKTGNLRAGCVRDPGAVPESLVADSHGSPESESELMQSGSEKLLPHHVVWLWRETKRRLETLDKRAREGKQVDEASEFARWLRFSGLRHVFNSVDGAPWREIDRLAGQVLDDCEAFWKREPQGPWVSLSELEAVNHKLDLIAARLASTESAPKEVLTNVISFAKIVA